MLSLLFSGADILDKARNSTVSDPHTQRHCCYFSNVVLLMEDLFCSFSAHKRFTELLSKEEKDLANVRAPMDRILTLPELKVRSNDTEMCLYWVYKLPYQQRFKYPLHAFYFLVERLQWLMKFCDFVLVLVTVQPLQETNLPRLLNVGKQRWKPHI